MDLRVGELTTHVRPRAQEDRTTSGGGIGDLDSLSHRYLVVRTKPADGVLDLDDASMLTFAQAAKRWYLPMAWGPP